MGSGCTQNNPSKNCLNPVSSNCVKYEGDPVPALGICTGDTITEVETAIINKLLAALEGTGITLPQVTLENCPYLKVLFAGKDKTITNLVQLLIDSDCNLKALIDQINSKINQTGNNTIFDLKCLSVPASPVTVDKIIQTLIDANCVLTTRVTNLEGGNVDNTIINQIVNTLLNDLITGPTGVKKTVTNGVAHYEMLGMVPIGGAIPYDGPLSNFDIDGQGRTGTEVENWRICNGKGGTKDWRGVTLVGAIQGVGGDTLSGNVDPLANQDATMNYAVGDRGGFTKVTITKDQLPNYQITTTDVKVTSKINLIKKWGRMQDSNSRIYSLGDDYTGGNPTPISINLDNVLGSVKFNTGGGGKEHENRMPYEAVIYIKRVK